MLLAGLTMTAGLCILASITVKRPLLIVPGLGVVGALAVIPLSLSIHTLVKRAADQSVPHKTCCSRYS